MTIESGLPLLVVLSSLLTGLVIFTVPEERHGVRTAFNLAAAVLKLVLVAVMFWEVYRGRRHETRMPFLPGIDLLLRADAFSLLFVTLSAVLWLATTVYAVGYLEGSAHRSRFFGFFSLCVASTMGVAFAGNLLTFFMFYELLTLTTYPLIVHRGTPESLRAGDVYLRYTFIGGIVFLAGVASTYAIAGSFDFAARGSLAQLSTEQRKALILTFALLVGGLGVKAALVPLHGWLPVAMVAPAPVSALLHAVAVVKAGAFGITRVVYDVFGARVARDLGVLQPLSFWAGATILYASLRALAQDDLKRRLAYSTVSQLSYIILGVATFGMVSTVGGIAHLVHQGIMKITLFFCAGNLASELGVHRVSELSGVAARMPLTMAAFTIASLGMIGLPPTAGFISKWYLGSGAIDADAPWVLGVLLVSSLLNAAYFLPVVYAAWFGEPTREWRGAQGKHETGAWLLLPTLVVAALSLLVGALAGIELSPLGFAKLIALEELGP